MSTSFDNKRIGSPDFNPREASRQGPLRAPSGQPTRAGKVTEHGFVKFLLDYVVALIPPLAPRVAVYCLEKILDDVSKSIPDTSTPIDEFVEFVQSGRLSAEKVKSALESDLGANLAALSPEKLGQLALTLTGAMKQHADSQVLPLLRLHVFHCLVPKTTEAQMCNTAAALVDQVKRTRVSDMDTNFDDKFNEVSGRFYQCVLDAEAVAIEVMAKNEATSDNEAASDFSSFLRDTHAPGIFQRVVTEKRGALNSEKAEALKKKFEMVGKRSKLSKEKAGYLTMYENRLSSGILETIKSIENSKPSRPNQEGTYDASCDVAGVSTQLQYLEISIPSSNEQVKQQQYPDKTLLSNITDYKFKKDGYGTEWIESVVNVAKRTTDAIERHSELLAEQSALQIRQSFWNALATKWQPPQKEVPDANKKKNSISEPIEVPLTTTGQAIRRWEDLHLLKSVKNFTDKLALKEVLKSDLERQKSRLQSPICDTEKAESAVQEINANIQSNDKRIANLRIELQGIRANGEQLRKAAARCESELGKDNLPSKAEIDTAIGELSPKLA